MKRLTILVLLTAGLLVVPAGAHAARPDPVRLDGVTVHLHRHTRQVVTVNHTKGMHARVTFWALRKRAFFASSSGWIGGGATPSRRQASSITAFWLQGRSSARL